MIAVSDNYDSFTWNLVQYLWELGAEVQVWRNDEKTVAEVMAAKPSQVVISPGPCTPNEAGICLDLIAAAAKARTPLLGVCLGHQAIGQAFGGKVERASRLMHGKTSPIRHDGRGVFLGLPSPFTATRYHSLVIQPDTLPNEFDVCAWSDAPDGDREIMGIRHKRFALHGVQFHPESFLTDCGTTILERFLKTAP
jgi:anthranilate synthase component II